MLWLVKLYALYNCDVKVYMKDKPGNYVLLFRELVDTQDRYDSRVIPYSTPLINNTEKKENIQALVIGITKDILNTGRNVPGDRLYSSTNIVEELFQ